MFIQFIKENRYISILLTVLRIYLGWEWLNAGWGKISGNGFNASGFIHGAIHSVSGDHPAVQPWWGTFLKDVALPSIDVFNVLIPWGEFLVGLALIFGIFTSFSLLMGLIMNFAYMLSGSTSTNPQMVILGLFLIMAGMNAGKIGLDRWVMPRLESFADKNSDRKQSPQSA
ncbi:DoxX family protein [Falsibacillus pallidus]|uniref:DoxX family protein n=1 Tax=Falsibacillus pallidus TaxID=493781 RepID=UPI003D97AF18